MALPPAGASGMRVPGSGLLEVLVLDDPQEGVCRWGLIVPDSQNLALLANLSRGAATCQVRTMPLLVLRTQTFGAARPVLGAGNQAQTVPVRSARWEQTKQGKGVKLWGAGWVWVWLGVGTVRRALPAGGPCSPRRTRNLDLNWSEDGQTSLCLPLRGEASTDGLRL